MKKLLLLVSFLTVCCCFVSTKTFAQDINQQNKQLNRILIFTFKPGIVSDSIKLVDDAYLEISKLPGIKSFEIGVKKVSDKEPKSIVHIYFLGFKTEQDVVNYIKTPQHDNLVKLRSTVTNIQLIDYWTEN